MKSGGRKRKYKKLTNQIDPEKVNDSNELLQNQIEQAKDSIQVDQVF